MRHWYRRFYAVNVGLVGVVLLVVLLSLFLFNFQTAFGQSELLFGQRHLYSVIFRGNGEAIVYARLVVRNPEERLMTEFSFEMPKVTPSEIVILQQVLPLQCLRYGYQGMPCLEYQEPNYAAGYYYGYGDLQAQYHKIQYTKSGNLYKFALPIPVQPQKSTSIVIAYAAKGYVKSRVGLFKFTFETLKVPARIEEVKVAVDVDSDLLLKGKKSQVQYAETRTSLPSAPALESFQSRELDTIVGGIGSYGPLVKEAKNLSPNESFLVRGEYATSWFRLYLRSLALSVLIIVVLITGVVYLARFLKRRRASRTVENIVPQQQPSSPNQGNVVTIVHPFYVVTGLASAVGVVGLTLLLGFLERSLRYVNYDPVLAVIGFITILVLYVLTIFGPAIYVATKFGWKGLLSTLVAMFLWLVILFILYFALFQAGLTSKIYPGPVPL